MFGSTSSFGQSSTSPFGSQSVFGQTSCATSNPFAQKPFGSPNTFGSATGSSVFGGTSTGVFGQPSTPAFGASSSPAFGSSTPAFGAPSTPAFGASSASFGGSSVFGQKPTFGGFGSTANQTNPFGQQTQPAFGSNLFGSAVPFGASSQAAFGAASAPAFGSTSTPSFGSTSSPPFGATATPTFGASTIPAFGATTTPAFGSTTSPAFGSTTTPLFGSTGAAFGASSTPAFGSTATPAFGTSSVFGSSNTPAFGASTTPTFGSSTAPAFGASTTPSFGFGSSPSFGQASSASTPFGTTTSPFGAQSSSFGTQTATPAFGSPNFGQAAFGGQRGGTRLVAYSPTPETDGTSGAQAVGKLESISAMPAYKEKSHDELRWEDYQLGDKGGPNPAGQPAGGTSFPAAIQPSPFGSPGTFGQPTGNPFSSSTSSNPFGPKTAPFGQTGFGSSSSSIFSSSLNASSSSPFGSTSTTPSLFGASSGSAFGSNSSPSLFGGSSAPAFSSSSSIFGSSGAGSSPAFGSGLSFGNPQSSGLFQSTSSIGQTPSPFGQSATGFQLTTPSSGSHLFSTPSTGFGGSLFANSAPAILSASNPAGFGQATPSLSTVFPQTAPSQTSGGLSFGNFGPAQAASSGSLGSTSSIFSQGAFALPRAATQSVIVVQPAPVINPFGTLPATPQMSIGRVGSAPSIQYGISTMPVAEMSVRVKVSSLLAPRHMSQRRIRLPARKYHPKTDGLRVPFFSDDEEASTTPKADAFVLPRENPRALVVRPVEQWPSRSTTDKPFGLKITPTPANENGNPADNGHNQQQNSNYLSPSKGSKPSQKLNGFHADHAEKETRSSPTTFSGHRAGEAAVVYGHGADVDALVPHLHHAEYYTEPRIQELAAKERSEPGFCCHVKDFVVGRHGYGSIKFDGETDVRMLDLDSIIQFNNREVIVYRDESKKPPIGQGLNKPAEVTLLNIMCMNKKAGLQYTEGPKVEKYKEMLMKKAQEQGAEFVSYDAVKGEWKFKVRHFSSYGVRDGICDI